MYTIYTLSSISTTKKHTGYMERDIKTLPDTKTGSEIPGYASAYFGVFLC